MKILVCIKQVPSSKEILFNENTGIIKRNDKEVIMNPCDLYAIETALKLKETLGGTVIAITMGPEKSTEVLKEAITLGADHGYLISDKRFAFSDLLATSHTLAEGINSLGKFDIVISGRESLDGSTGQLAGELAEKLNIPIVNNVSNLATINKDQLEVLSIMDDYIEKVKVSLPCFLAVKENIFEPRFPNYLDLLRSENMELGLITLDNLKDKDEKNYGINGSYSVISKVFKKPISLDAIPNFDVLNNSKSAELLIGDSKDLALKLKNKLKELKFIK